MGENVLAMNGLNDSLLGKKELLERRRVVLSVLKTLARLSAAW